MSNNPFLPNTPPSMQPIGTPSSVISVVNQMGGSFKQLGQVVAALAANTYDLYIPPTSIMGIVTSIVVCNYSGAGCTFDIYNHATGTTATTATALFYQQNQGAHTSFIVTFDGGLTVRNPGTLRVKAGTNDSITFTAYGWEQGM